MLFLRTIWYDKGSVNVGIRMYKILIAMERFGCSFEGLDFPLRMSISLELTLHVVRLEQAARVLQLEGFGLAFLMHRFLDINPDKR